MDYLSYTTKVYQLVQRFTLGSVLLFGREYRKLQASMGFRWGTNVQHLHTLFLQTRNQSLLRPASKLRQANRMGKNLENLSRGRIEKSAEILTPLKAARFQTADFNTFVAWVLPEAPSANTHKWTKKPLDVEVHPSPGLHFDAWYEELQNDPDKSFLLDGIRHGFDIIDEDVVVSPVRSKNHPSAQLGSPLYEMAAMQVRKEIENGNYIICESPPHIIRPLAAIPKPDGDVRLIMTALDPLAGL